MADRYWEAKRRKGIKDADDNVLPTKKLNDEYWRRGGHWTCHHNGSAATYCMIGNALAEALIKLSRPRGSAAGLRSSTRPD